MQRKAKEREKMKRERKKKGKEMRGSEQKQSLQAAEAGSSRGTRGPAMTPSQCDTLLFTIS